MKQIRTFFCINRSQICLLPLFSLFFWALLLWLPFALHVVSGSREKLNVNYKRSLEMDLDQSGMVDHFTTIFAPKLITLLFDCDVGMSGISKPDHCTERPILALPSNH